jgi:Nif-specific regulatory protein
MENEKDSLKNRINEMEREEIISALRECDWVMARAARRLGITERMIGYKIKKYGIRVKEVRWIENSHQQDL